MIAPHPRLEVNVAEQLARSFVLTAHTPSSESPSQPVNHGQHAAASDFFNSLLGEGAPDEMVVGLGCGPSETYSTSRERESRYTTQLVLIAKNDVRGTLVAQLWAAALGLLMIQSLR